MTKIPELTEFNLTHPLHEYHAASCSGLYVAGQWSVLAHLYLPGGGSDVEVAASWPIGGIEPATAAYDAADELRKIIRASRRLVGVKDHGT
jgi:hypothetical protein